VTCYPLGLPALLQLWPRRTHHGVTLKTTREPEPIVFRGRSRADAKRRALNYWYMNRQELGVDLRTFSERCRLQADNCTIHFYPTR
jgi:hypothetical protein